jgi:hypothetical protein
MAAWLARETCCTVGDVRRQLTLAACLQASPEIAGAVAGGVLSPAVAEALAPAVTATVDRSSIADLVEVCAGASPSGARRAGTRWIEIHPPTGSTPASRELERLQVRSLQFRDCGDGTMTFTGLVPTLQGRMIRNALQHVAGRPVGGDQRTYDQKLADALVMLCDAYNKGAVTGGRQRPTVMVTIDIDVLEGRADGVGYTADGDIIPADAVRVLCENANLQRVLTSKSLPIDVGRSKRLATNTQYAALVARDGGCRFGCDVPATWCEVDHIDEWEHGGHTNLNKLWLLCCYHHAYRHRPDVTLHGDANNLTIELPDGRTMPLPARGPTTQTKAA